MIAGGDVYADADGPGVYLVLHQSTWRRHVWHVLVLEAGADERAGEKRLIQDDWLEVCAAKVAP